MLYGRLQSWREKQFVSLSLLDFVFFLRISETLFNFYFPFLFHPQNSVAVASIHLPLAGTPISSSALQSVDNSTCKLQFIVFRNGKLFPCTGNSSNLADDGKRRSVSTPVAFTKLGKRKSIFFIIMHVMSTLYYIAHSDMLAQAHRLHQFTLRNMLIDTARCILCFSTKTQLFPVCFILITEISMCKFCNHLHFPAAV